MFETLKADHPELTETLELIESWNLDVIEPLKLRSYPGVTDNNIMDIIFAMADLRVYGLGTSEWRAIDKNGKLYPEIYWSMDEVPEYAYDLTYNTRLTR